MLSASRSLRRGAAGGKALPDIQFLSVLHDAGVHFRFGQVVMWTARPGAGKSNVAQAMVTQWAQADIPGFYFSLDMDAWTAGVRQAAAVTGHTQNSIAAALDGPGEAYYEDALSGLPIDYCFDTTPQLPDIQQEMDAYVELWDRFPSVIVVDNLLNIEAGEGANGDLKFVMKNIQALARSTGASVHVLHHAREGAKDTTRPPRMDEIDNKLSQVPEVIISLAPDEDEMNLAVLKLRSGGKSDPEAKRIYKVAVDYGTLSFSKRESTSVTSSWWDEVEE